MLLPEVGRNKIKVRVIILGISSVLWVGVFLHLFPVWWMVSGSFRNVYEIFKMPPDLFPRQPNLAIWKTLLQTVFGRSFLAVAREASGRVGDYHQWGVIRYGFHIYIKNSLIITAGIMFFQISLGAMAAYALSKLVASPRWNRIIFLYIVGTLFIPSVVNLIPSYLILKNFPFCSRKVPFIPFTNTRFPHINLIGTYWSVILPAMISAYNVLLFKGFFDGIPNEIIHAARLDGASEMNIFVRMVLPISKPVFAVVAWMTFGSAWNSFMWPLIVLANTDSKWPLSLLIYKIQQLALSEQPALESITGTFVGGYPLVMALATVESIPLIIVFIIFREQLMKGIRLRGFK